MLRCFVIILPLITIFIKVVLQNFFQIAPLIHELMEQSGAKSLSINLETDATDLKRNSENMIHVCSYSSVTEGRRDPRHVASTETWRVKLMFTVGIMAALLKGRKHFINSSNILLNNSRCLSLLFIWV